MTEIRNKKGSVEREIALFCLETPFKLPKYACTCTDNTLCGHCYMQDSKKTAEFFKEAQRGVD